MAAHIKCRNVKINGHRTSMRLEPEMWDALAEISKWEQMSIDDICSAVARRKHPECSVSSATRVFIMAYFRDQAMQADQMIAPGAVRRKRPAVRGILSLA